MPYIKQEAKTSLETRRAATPGELTYQLQQLLKLYWINSPRNYATIAEILGSIRGAEFDFEQRIVKDYERMKLEANGDVW